MANKAPNKAYDIDLAKRIAEINQNKPKIEEVVNIPKPKSKNKLAIDFNKTSVVQGIILSEILGPPKGRR